MKPFKHISYVVLLVLVSVSICNAAVITDSYDRIIKVTDVYVNALDETFNVDFHWSYGFYRLWDNDRDLEYGDNDYSILNRAPAFWEGSSAEWNLGVGIAGELENSGRTFTSDQEGFLLPSYQHGDDAKIVAYYFYAWGGDWDYGNRSFTTFVLDKWTYPGRPYVSVAVPIPSAIWLLGSGLIGIIGIRRKFKK